jgi:hypothetical protein
METQSIWSNDFHLERKLQSLERLGSAFLPTQRFSIILRFECHKDEVKSFSKSLIATALLSTSHLAVSLLEGTGHAIDENSIFVSFE